MLDHFDDRRHVESGQRLVAIDERAMHQRDAFALPRRQAVEVQSLRGDLQCPHRHIHAERGV
jgi:hypothetical protein